MMTDMLRAPHQDRDPVVARHHAAIDADIHDPGFGILGDAAAIGEEIAPAVEPVPMRRRKLVEIDVRAGEDVLLHRAGGDDLRRDAAGEDGAADLDQLARMGVGRQPQHHCDAPVAQQRGSEDAAAAAVRLVVVLDVVEQQRLAGPGALRQPRDGAELEVPIDLGVDLVQLALRAAARRSSRAYRRTPWACARPTYPLSGSGTWRGCSHRMLRVRSSVMALHVIAAVVTASSFEAIAPFGRDHHCFNNLSAGGAISVTRSRTSRLLESGASTISRGSSRAVQA